VLDVIWPESAEPSCAEVLGEDVDGPAVAGTSGVGDRSAGESLVLPEVEEFAESDVARSDRQAQGCGAVEFVQSPASFGLGRCKHLSAFAVDGDPTDPTVLVSVEEESTLAASSS
jgi:hypothetical protein